jgi:CubicO group peptidase (beta-lactamase class C family)
MNEEDVPGLSIALIRNSRVVWTEGFGVTNTLTGKPVTSETVFETASISKVVNGYTALRLVEEDVLLLDNPVHVYLNIPWLPPSAYADKITLRHLLSHSSGLGDDPFFRSKDIAFEPGTGFLYSGLGAEYVRELIEQVSGKSLEEVARVNVFDPLGMSSSSFINETDVMSTMANGHMRYLLVFLAFLLPFLAALAIVGILTAVSTRLFKGRWCPARQTAIGALALAFVLTEILLFFLIGKQFPNLMWITLPCGAIFLAFMFLSYLFIRRLMSRIERINERRVLKATIATIYMIMSFIVFLAIVGSLFGPVPRNSSSRASAMGSLRSTAPDLAVFLIELATPRHLSEDLSSQIDSVQVSINQDFSWGLGIGIQHTAYGDAIWQNAITFAFRGIMVMYPVEGWGVVVLTNSESGLPVAYDVAERALGGQAKWEFL